MSKKMTFSQLQWLARVGKLPYRNPHGVANYKKPVCASCQFGKQCRHSSAANTSIRNQDKFIEIKKGDLFPGDKVSIDHYQSAVPDRVTIPDGVLLHKKCLMVDQFLWIMPVVSFLSIIKFLLQ